MIDYYVEIRFIHIAAVIASGSLFFVRGLAVNLGAQWAMAAPLRYLSYAIDTVLLAAAVMLAAMLHQYPFVHGWLTTKVLLLVVYIVLGSLALKRARTQRMRWVAFLAALLVFGYIVSVARAHHPLGIFA
mgnify:CR=1 FL=1|jgi:uncharacterized membrane protein SirB2